MLKRIIAICLLVVTLFSLSGCDFNELKAMIYSEPTTNTEPTTSTAPIAANANCWSVKEMTKPALSPLIVEEIKLTNDLSVKIAKTPFDINIEKAFQDLRKNEFLNKNYGNFARTIEEEASGKYDNVLKNQKSLYVTESLIAGINNTGFTVSFIQDTAEFSNVYAIELVFTNIKIDDNLQSQVADIVKIVFGDNADYLLYAKDHDGQSYHQYVPFANLDNKGLSELIETENGDYYVTREIQSGKTNDTLTISFNLGVSFNPNQNNYLYYGGDLPSVYNTLGISFDDLFADSFGNSNVAEMDSFGDSVFTEINSKYTHTELNEWAFYNYETYAGEADKYLAISCQGYQEGTLEPYIKLQYESMFYEKDKKVNAVMIYTWCELIKQPEESDEETFNKTKTVILSLFSDMDLKDIVYDSSKATYKKNITVSIMNVTANGTLVIEQTKTGYEFTIEALSTNN